MSAGPDKVPMHFQFSTVEILWTLTFAALLVLLVVLLGRDRVSRFPWFTTSIVLVALRMLASRLLFGKMAPLTSSEIFLVMADVATVVSLLVVVEMARRGFARASRTAWVVGTLVLLAIGGTVVAFWGAWPAWKTLAAGSTLGHLRLMQLAAQKGDLLADVLIIELGVLMAFAGSRFNAGWHSHTQRIVIGLSTGSIMQLVVRTVWQKIANGAPPRSQAEYTRITGLQDKLFNANSAVYLLILVWWIACLWIEEPGSKPAAPAKEISNEAAIEGSSPELTDH
jgi:hypothetical protein